VAITCPKCHSENPETKQFCADCGTSLTAAGEPGVSVTRTLETTADELVRGTLFAGRYEIIEELGTGGMGKVYRVFDTRIKEEVALKLLRPEVGAHARTLERFRNEIRLARKIVHRNVCRMFDMGEERGTQFITMEYVPGEDLKSLIRRIGQLPAGKAVFIAREIAEGLAEAHKLGIVHRDLKPGNIMIDKEGQAKIMDFGIARSIAGGGTTAEGAIIGTPEYMSPEQVEGKEADQRSDIYALGIILFEMVTGRLPFEGETPFSIATKHKTEPPPVPKKLVPQIPEGLNRLILRCLEKDREKRYQTTGEFLADLAAVDEALPTGERISAQAKPKTSREITVKFKVRKVLVPAFGVLIAAVLTGVLLWHPWKTKPSPAGMAAAVAPSLVALPCKVLGSPESAFLTDAVPSTLSTLLGEVQGVDMKVSPTSFELEKVHGDLDKIADAYGVQTFVLSTATAEGDHLIFNIQLADARTRKVRWSHQYQGSRENYAAMAHEAAQGICKEVLPEAPAVVPTSGPTSNSEAELAFQQGKYYSLRYLEHGDRADFDRALKALNRAFELNLKDAATAAQIAYLYAYATLGLGQIPHAQGIGAMEAWVQKALTLDPRCSMAWTARSWLEGSKSDADMEKQIEWSLKGAQLGMGNPYAQQVLAAAGLATGGSLSLAVEALREVLRLDPLALDGYSFRALFLARSGRPEEALPVVDTELSLDPGNHWAPALKVYALVEMGRTKEAATLFKLQNADWPSGGFLGDRVQDIRWLLSLAGDDDRDARASLKAIIARFADPVVVWNDLQDNIHDLLPAVNRRFGKDAALDLLILSTKRGATMPYDVLMLRPDLKDIREDPRAKDVIQKTKTPFDLLVRILQDARARGELPKYLEKPFDDLLKKLQIKL
jgi:tetratricopeptide (TPR) repeat protein